MFADLERIAGRFPNATWHSPDARARDPHGCWRAAPATFPAPTIRWSNWSGELAGLRGKEAALAFTSGYVSNETGIATIAKLLPNCVILSDAWNHNSMIEGVRRAGVKKRSGGTTTSATSKNCW